MDRRRFFKRGLDKISTAVVDAADTHARKKARHWIRPPYARDELDFLLTCTRCDDCARACPYTVIFALPLARGAEVAGTPALDILNKGCHLCKDWPCVSACTTGALNHPSEVSSAEVAESRPDLENSFRWPLLAVAAIDRNHCLPYRGPECGACRDSCPIPGVLTFSAQRGQTERSPTERSPTERSPTERSPTVLPVIDADRCVGCGLCREACITDPKAVKISALEE